MSRSIRKETSSLAFGMVGRVGGSSAGFVVATLNAASAASREVVVLRVLALGLHFLKTNWVMMRWIILGELSGPGGFLPIRCKLKADVGASSVARRTSVRCALSHGKGAVASRGLPFQALANT